MDDTNNTFELIEQYLGGELKGEALQSFEERLASDPEFVVEVERQKMTHKVVDIYAQLKTKTQVEDLHAKAKHARKQRNIRIIPLAASIALIISLGIWFYPKDTQISNDDLVAANFDLYPDRITTMGNTPDSLLALGVSAYNHKDFNSALTIFSEIPNKHPQADLIHLYGGISYLGIHEPDNALLVLRRIKENSPYREAARWYQALAYLEKQDTEQVRTLLQEIVQEDAFPGEKARILLEELQE
ncbi:MAG: hypothetical protein DHS20C18_39470 [Saprospiraceae bacterium]|nr:MAG: hypothetical protein DHS20C18_39470 [Saprospiraceae bacterium]